MGVEDPSRLIDGALSGAIQHRCAVAFLDVVDFSSQMGVDEQETYARWKRVSHRVLRPLLQAHSGRFVKSTGDGLLATFEAPYNAVAWARAVQREARIRGEGLRLRIGLHLGEVIEDADHDVFGETVNIAARLETRALPGSILLSRAILDALPSAQDLFLKPTGPLRLKNIRADIEAFHLATDARDLRALKLSNAASRLPSIAVLPFAAEPASQVFAEGLLDDLISSLSGVQELNVIARSSVKALGSASAFDTRTVGETLGVDYLVTGALQHRNDRLRARIEVIDAQTSDMIASNRMDFAEEDIFDIQDRFLQEIVALVAPEVKRATLARARRKPPGNHSAYEATLRAIDKVASLERKDFEAARVYLEAAIEADHEFPTPLAWLARWFTLRVGQGWSEDPAADSAAALRAAQQAIRLDRRNALALATFGHVTAYTTRDYDTAINYLDRAVAAGPNNAIARTLRSVTLSFMGRVDEARFEAESALQLSPFDDQLFQFFAFLALACYCGDAFEDAARWAERSLAENPNYTNAQKLLVVSRAALGEVAAARSAAKVLLAAEPRFTTAAYSEGRPPFAEPHRTQNLIKHFTLAGIPEGPAESNP